MKKKTVQFKSSYGNEYTLTRPSLDDRIEIFTEMGTTPEEIAKNNLKTLVALARASVAKDVNLDDVEDMREILEIGRRADELASLGK